jgi:hypothetical protein
MSGQLCATACMFRRSGDALAEPGIAISNGTGGDNDIFVIIDQKGEPVPDNAYFHYILQPDLGCMIVSNQR